jgi:LPXTG-site transpeptidase (sortase) family protein
VTTDSNGDWTATVPPGSTTANVDETDTDFTSVVPAGWTQTEGADPTTVTAVAGQDTSAGNDGYYTPGSISGTVYNDLNGNGGFDTGEPGIENVTVTLYDGSDNLIVTTTTDASGNYSFPNLPAGDYYVVESDPSGYTSTGDVDGSANGVNRIDVTLNAGDNSTGNDFFDVLPAITVTKSANPVSVPETGGSVIFTYTVTNSGAVPVTITSLSDDQFTISGDADCQVGTTLAAGASCTFDYTTSLSGAAGTTHTNTFTAEAEDADGNSASDDDDAEVTFTDVLPDLAIAKSNDAASPLYPGNTFTWTITVTNANNTATFAAGDVVMRDALPAGATYANLSSPTPAVANLACAMDASNVITCTAGGGNVTLAAGASFTVTVDVTVTTSGDLENTAVVDPDGNVNESNEGNNSSTDSASADGLADLAITKTVDNPSPIFGEDVVFTITVTNNGPSDATGVVVDDLLPAGLDYVSDNGGGAYDSNTGIWTIGNLNSGGSVSLEITATVTQVGSITNTASVSGNETDPNPNNNESSVEVGGVFDPPSAIKTFNEAGLPELEFRMVWINSGNTTAIDIQVTDGIPVGTTYVPGSITCVPRGSSSNAAVVSLPLSPTAVPNAFCGYDAGNNRIQWQGTIGPDDGNLTEEAAANEVVITFRVTVDDNVNQVQNQGFARVDVDGDGNFEEETVLGTSIIGSNQVVWTREPGGGGGGGGGGTIEPLNLPSLLPVTGFAPGVITALPEQPASKMYSSTDVWLEIPNLGVQMPIVGVPLVDGDWNVSWLGNQAGWLEGTAFPSWKGNSAVTGHVTLANGVSGPFAKLGNLKWGDKVIVHAYGYVYTYQVRENKVIAPNNTSVLKHETDSWLTLVTCKDYNEATNSYANRISVRAVLISVQKEPARTVPFGAR